MNFAEYLHRWARAAGANPAVVVGQRVHADWSALSRRVAAMAAGLRERFGIEPGERVGMLMKNAPEFVEVLFATWHAGAVAVPLNPRLHPQEIAWILGDAQARLCVATPELATALAASSDGGGTPLLSTASDAYGALGEREGMELHARGGDDLAWLFYTSGTTGRPKGAMLTHRNLAVMSWGFFVDYEKVGPGDGAMHIGPMCHGSGLYMLPHVVGGAPQVIPESGGFDPDEALDLLAGPRRLNFFAAPTLVGRLTAAADARSGDFPGMNCLIYGGAPMYAEDLRRAMRRFGPRFAQIYGQGESPMAISVLGRAAHREAMTMLDDPAAFSRAMGSVGVAQCVVQVRIAGSGDEPLPPGTPGEVLVRGDTVMAGYWRNEAATRAALHGGWLHTGDIGVQDAMGRITLKDRSKDVIISGGSNIYPREVEEVLLLHPAVREVSVVGRRDAQWGESVVAFVACHPGQRAEAAELDALCLANIARYKRPREYRWVDALPKSGLGKILKTELRKLLGESGGGP